MISSSWTLLHTGEAPAGKYGNLKMKYITLAYDWLNPCKAISKINISLTANNVFCLTRYSWFDPDVNAGGTNAACPGVDSYSYPSARTYALGIKVVL